MFQFTNIYVLAAFGTIGGALFGFDISSMSAWIGAGQYTNYFNSPDSNLQGGITVGLRRQYMNPSSAFNIDLQIGLNERRFLRRCNRSRLFG